MEEKQISPLAMIFASAISLVLRYFWITLAVLCLMSLASLISLSWQLWGLVVAFEFILGAFLGSVASLWRRTQADR